MAETIYAYPSSQGRRSVRQTDLARRVRAMVSRAQDDICAICGSVMERDRSRAPTKALKITLDHVVPLRRGGQDRLGNLVAAHEGCNVRKGDRAPNGCELIWLLAVNARLSVGPVRW